MRSIYQERTTIRIVRTQHVINLWPRQSAGGLREALAKIPAEAVLVDIEEVADSDFEESLVFEVEKEEEDDDGRIESEADDG